MMMVMMMMTRIMIVPETETRLLADKPLESSFFQSMT